VWSTAARTLTAGTNIVLAKGTGITGFNDLSAAQVNAEADTALSDVGLTAIVTGRIDAAISTRLAAAGYVAPDDTAVLTALAIVDGNVDSVLTRLPAALVAGRIDASVGALGAGGATAINAEVVDALATDTRAEPGQGAPPATLSMAAKIDYVYKAWRNRATQSATEYRLYADDAVTVDQKATVSDDGTTFNRAEMAGGP
jgi:hypothetical protein